MEVRGDLTLDRIHTCLQVAMGWTDSHLHRFGGQGVKPWQAPWFATAYDEEDEDTGTAESAARIDQVLRTPGDWLTYIYDFCDGWVHRVEIEGVRPGDRGRRAGAVPAGGCGRHTNMERNRRGPPRRSRPARNCSTCCSRPTARAANPRATSSGRPS